MDDHDHVVTFTFNPALEGEYAIVIMHMDDAETLSAQSWMLPAQGDQLARETQVIDHLFVACVEARPIEQQVRAKAEIVRPLFVLQEFLSHEEHRNPRRGQPDAGGHAGAAAPEPRAWISGSPRRAIRCSRPS